MAAESVGAECKGFNDKNLSQTDEHLYMRNSCIIVFAQVNDLP